MSTIVVPAATDIGAVAPEVATTRKAQGDPDPRLANALIAVATAAKTDIETLEGASGGAATPPGVAAAAVAGGGTLDEITVAEAGTAARTVTTLWIRPTDDVTANNTNFVTIEWFLRNSAGAVLANVTNTTKVTGEGATGDWSAFARVETTVAWTVPVKGCITVYAQSTGSGTIPRSSFGADF